MDHLARFTRYVVGRSASAAASAIPRRPPPRRSSMRCGAAWPRPPGPTTLEGRRVGVIGLGKVGFALAARLAGAARRWSAATSTGALRALCGRARRPDRALGRGGHGARAGRARSLRGRRPDRRGARALDRLPRGGGRRQQPAHRPRRGAHPAGARHPLRARLPGQLRRSGPRVAGMVRAAPARAGADRPRDGAPGAGARDRRGRGHTPIEVAERQALERVAAARTG